MKRLLLILSVLALSTGCIGPSSILLLNAQTLDGTCAPTDQIYAGTVMAGTSNYFVAFEVQSELDDTDITVNGSTINPASRNDFIAQTAVLEYLNASTGMSLGIAPQHIAMSAVIPAGAKAGESYIVLNLLNATVAGAIATAGQIAVQVHLVGRLVSSNTLLETNTVQFPLTVYSGGTCTAPAPADAPCGNVSQNVVCN